MKRSRKRKLKRGPSSVTSSSEDEFLEFTVSSGGNEDVVKWGYALLFLCWFVFVAGIGGVIGIWDWVFGLEAGVGSNYACFFVLCSVSGFIWITINWIGLKYFRMTSSKV